MPSISRRNKVWSQEIELFKKHRVVGFKIRTAAAKTFLAEKKAYYVFSDEEECAIE